MLCVVYDLVLMLYFHITDQNQFMTVDTYVASHVTYKGFCISSPASVIHTRVVSQLARSIRNLPSLLNIMGSAHRHNCMWPLYGQPSFPYLNIMG